jgi:hypothetical protein
MKRMVFGVVLAFNCFASQASTEADAAAAFRNYWGNFSCGKYKQAAQTILPSDLKGTREHVLPVMISEIDSKNAAGSKAAATFFSAAKKKPQDFDEVDVYTGLNRLIGADEATLKILCSAKVKAVKVSLKDKESAVVSYSVRLASGEVVEGDPETLVRDSGKWYLKMGMSPQEAAKALREAFKQ